MEGREDMDNACPDNARLVNLQPLPSPPKKRMKAIKAKFHKYTLGGR